MADPFATGLAALHRGPASVAADYMGPGGTVPIRVVRTTTPIDMDIGGSLVRAGSTVLEIARSAVDVPAGGDLVVIGDRPWQILGEPKLDVEGLTWMCEAAEG